MLGAAALLGEAALGNTAWGTTGKWGAATGGVEGAAAICSESETGCGPVGCEASNRATAGPLARAGGGGMGWESPGWVGEAD